MGIFHIEVLTRDILKLRHSDHCAVVLPSVYLSVFITTDIALCPVLLSFNHCCVAGAKSLGAKSKECLRNLAMSMVIWSLAPAFHCIEEHLNTSCNYQHCTPLTCYRRCWLLQSRRIPPHGKLCSIPSEHSIRLQMDSHRAKMIHGTSYLAYFWSHVNNQASRCRVRWENGGKSMASPHPHCRGYGVSIDRAPILA